MTNKEIFEGIARKDNQTFLYLYKQHKDRIIHMVRKNSGADDEALDIFQEGIIALWSNIVQGKFQLQADTQIGTYLFALCRNIWISKLRKRKIVKDIDEEVGIADAAQLDAMEEEYEQINELTLVIKQLGDACQKLLHLFYYKKSSLKEIAHEMGFTEKTAKNNKYRCMQNLKELYKKRNLAL